MRGGKEKEKKKRRKRKGEKEKDKYTRTLCTVEHLKVKMMPYCPKTLFMESENKEIIEEIPRGYTNSMPNRRVSLFPGALAGFECMFNRK